MTNLLIETEEVLKENGKSFDDVKWIGTLNGGTISVGDFKKAANREYDSGFGIENVCLGLLVVGDNWWLERHEYDGSEWWEFKTIPSKPEGELRWSEIWYML